MNLIIVLLNTALLISNIKEEFNHPITERLSGPKGPAPWVRVPSDRLYSDSGPYDGLLKAYACIQRTCFRNCKYGRYRTSKISSNDTIRNAKLQSYNSTFCNISSQGFPDMTTDCSQTGSHPGRTLNWVAKPWWKLYYFLLQSMIESGMVSKIQGMGFGLGRIRDSSKPSKYKNIECWYHFKAEEETV